MSDYLEASKEIIWNNQGISSYGLLEKLIRDHEYSLGNGDAFKSLLSKLKDTKEIRYDELQDRFYKYKELSIKIMSKVDRLHNCFNCLFRVEAKNAPYSEVNEILTKPTMSLDSNVICALDPTLPVGPSKMGYLPSNCPLNAAIKVSE